MTDNFEKIRILYKDGYRQHGDSPKALLTPKGRNSLRFRAIDSFVVHKGIRVLDYGCGLGYLYGYLLEQGREVLYTGCDIVPEFLNACAKKYPAGFFKQIDALGKVEGEFDVVFSSGVFNLQTHHNISESKAYAFDKIAALYELAQEVLVCDFLSTFVDFEQQDAQHFSPGEIAEFCCRRLGRRFQIRHDLLPYEFTLVAWKDDSVKRPENLFSVDT